MSKLRLTRRTFLAGTGAAVLVRGGLLAPSAAAAAVKVGAPAPVFTATATTGKGVSLADYRGQIVVLEWTNHDCPYVRKHYTAKNMQTQQREAAAQGVVWLTSASSATGEEGYVTAAQANDLTKSRDAAPAAVLLDPQSKIARAYGATVTPHMYIIDAAGTLVYKGGIDSIPSADIADIAKAKQYVRVGLDEVLAGKPVSDSSTRPYGCSLKYPRTSS